MRHYFVRQLGDEWWVRARAWLDDGPPGPEIDIRGPFTTRLEAWAYVHEVQARQIAGAARRKAA